MKTLSPGSTIGILGGGQLGRMTAMAAAKLGFNCHIFCPDENEPAVSVSAFHTKASFDDDQALEQFARSVDVVTLEWENLPIKALETVSRFVDVFPGPHVLQIAQDREAEKSFARGVGIGTADFVIVRSAVELERALTNFALPAILKSTRMGYDGKGQVKISKETDPVQAWQEMGSPIGILEAFVDFSCEVSVLVAARTDGSAVSFPVVQNIHKNQILSETHAPANLDAQICEEATNVAQTLAKQLKVVGLLAVELFVLRKEDGQGRRILMNEIAPRPHNSGHWTMDACVTSQFEQLVRAICGLPLGDVTPHSRAVMYNLIGADVEKWPQLLSEPQTCLHLYGKHDVKAGRKMGHVNVLKGAWESGQLT